MAGKDDDKLRPLDYFNPNDGPRRRSIWVAILTGFLTLFLFASFLLPSISRSRPLSSQLVSLSRLREIGQGILLYTNDFGGRYPDSLADLVLTENIESGALVSPLSNDTFATGPTTQAIVDQLAKPGHVSYIYLGKGLSKYSVTPGTIVAYEQLSDNANSVNTLFGDGHVGTVNGSIIAKIAAQAASGKRPVTMPYN